MKFFVAAILCGLTILTRMLPNSLNFTPVLAIALFTGSYYKGAWRFVVPLVGMVVADIYWGFYPGMAWNYGAIALAATLKMGLRPSPAHFLTKSTLASILFFVVSNFGVWWAADLYSQDLPGLLQCYQMGFSFLRNTWLSTICYSALILVAYHLVIAAKGREVIINGRQKR